MTGSRTDRSGAVLVFGQFACIAALLLGGGWTLHWWGWALFALGLIIFVLAAVSLGGNNFTIMPNPRPENTLSKRGIYRFVRHPMYLSVLLCGGGVSFGSPTMVRWIALAVVLVVLVVKVGHEERWLTTKHPEYPELMRGVARLLPGVW